MWSTPKTSYITLVKVDFMLLPNGQSQSFGSSDWDWNWSGTDLRAAFYDFQDKNPKMLRVSWQRDISRKRWIYVVRNHLMDSGQTFYSLGFSTREAEETFARLWVESGYPRFGAGKKFKLYHRIGQEVELRRKLVRLAHSNPEIRPHLLPLLKKPS